MITLKPRHTALLCRGVLFIICAAAAGSVFAKVTCEKEVICDAEARPDYKAVVEEILHKYPDSELRDYNVTAPRS